MNPQVLQTTSTAYTTMVTVKPFIAVITTSSKSPPIPKVPELPPYVTETDSFEMLKPGILAGNFFKYLKKYCLLDKEHFIFLFLKHLEKIFNFF